MEPWTLLSTPPHPQRWQRQNGKTQLPLQRNQTGNHSKVDGALPRPKQSLGSMHCYPALPCVQNPPNKSSKGISRDGEEALQRLLGPTAKLNLLARANQATVRCRKWVPGESWVGGDSCPWGLQTGLTPQGHWKTSAETSPCFNP